MALAYEQAAGEWRCAAVAPSYLAFHALRSRNEVVDWSERPEGSRPEGVALLRAARRLLPGEGYEITVAVDLPISRRVIDRRREADDAVAREFGGRKCGTHSPSSVRPGSLAARFSDQLTRDGRELATTESVPIKGGAYLLEVYPHVSLLALCEAAERLPYKVSKARAGAVSERLERLLQEFERILGALRARIVGIDLPLPTAQPGLTLGRLKRFEDALDALVCVWTGIEFLEGRAEPYGDSDAAIWCPASLRRAPKRSLVEHDA